MARPQRARALIEFDLVALADVACPPPQECPLHRPRAVSIFLFAGVQQAIDLAGEGLRLFVSIGLRRQGVR